MDLEYSIESAHVFKSALALLRPYDVVGARKVRVGRPFDGGYVMIDAFDGIEAAYSLGINDDISWDSEIAQRDIDIFQYDHTIEDLPYQSSRFHWQKIGIAAFSSGNMMSITDIIENNGHGESKNLLLKCDIECAEWEALQHTSKKTLSQFSQIVIELHDIYRLGDPTDFFVRHGLVNLTNSHKVVHIHGNNYGGIRTIGGISVPNVLEVTLLRKDMGEFIPSASVFPTSMDMPCNKDRADIFLGSFAFS